MHLSHHRMFSICSKIMQVFFFSFLSLRVEKVISFLDTPSSLLKAIFLENGVANGSTFQSPLDKPLYSAFVRRNFL